MKPQFKTIITGAIAVALFTIGLVAFLLFIGDEAPEYPMSLGEFVLLKSAAMAAMAAVAYIIKKMYEHGLLPKWMTE